MFQDLKQHIGCFMERLRSYNFFPALEAFWTKYVHPFALDTVYIGLLAVIIYTQSEINTSQIEALERLDTFIGDGNRVTAEVVAWKMQHNREEVQAYIFASEERLKLYVESLIQEECN